MTNYKMITPDGNTTTITEQQANQIAKELFIFSEGRSSLSTKDNVTTVNCDGKITLFIKGIQ